MARYLWAPRDLVAVVQALSDPALKIVTLTVTEGGYNLDEHTGEFDLSNAEISADLGREHPRTTFGILTAALKARRDAGVPPFTVASCDNLRSNGHTARTATVGYAAANDPAFAEWISGNVAFPNSMVDRIAPGVDAVLTARLNAITGIADAVPVVPVGAAPVIPVRFRDTPVRLRSTPVRLRGTFVRLRGTFVRLRSTFVRRRGSPVRLVGPPVGARDVPIGFRLGG